MEENDDRLQLQHLAGRNITKFAPLFSPDAKLIFVIVDKVVQVFSTSTGQSIRFLEGAKHALISLEYDLLAADVLVACTESGEVIRWNWSSGRVVSRVKLDVWGEVRYETFNFINHYAKGDCLCAFVTVVKKGNPVQCYIVDTVGGNVLNCPLNLKLGRQSPIVAVDLDIFKYLVIAQGSYLFFVDYKSWQWKKLTNSNNVRITCVKTHPKEKTVATGDETGKITLWRQFFETSDRIQTTLYHWHHTRVTSLAFTSSGSGFYSSGLEAVLVRWNIDNRNRCDFVPRMSSIVLHITAGKENSNLAVCTADNGIQILDVDLKTKCTLQEFTYIFDDKTGTDIFPVGLRVNPRQNTLVLNGRTGHLQFYSAHTRSMLYNMDIVGQNQLSMETGKILYNIRVTHAAFNIDWMATGELYNDEQHLPELRLKFWQYQNENQSYALNTNVELPHEGGFKAIEFSSPYYLDNLLCATVGLDNVIKVWSLEDSNNIYKKGKVWYCVGQTSYKNLSLESIGFSQDGSLIAAGFGNTLCVYKAESLKLLTALIPSGTFDGCLHKAQISVARLNRNGSRNDLNSKKQKIMQLFTNLLHANEETLLKEIKNSVKKKNVQQFQSVDESQKKLLYKRIQSMSQLNLFQKLLIYQKLGISFQLTEQWRSKIVDYVRSNLLIGNTSTKLTKELNFLSTKSRFKAKYKIHKYTERKLNYDKNVASKLLPLMSMLTVSENSKPHLTNGVDSHREQLENNKCALPPLQSVLSIKKIAFCFGDFAHLVIACTENRILIWNLLNLRLQTVLKLSAEHIAVDSQTNLISVFTKNQELYVFLPSVVLPLYFRANMPRIHGIVWLPRKYPKSQAVMVNWQARSTLYFLTENHEIMYLGTKDDFEEPSLAFVSDADGSGAQYSTFGTFATNQFKSTETSKQGEQGVSIGVHGKAAVKSFLEMSTHTMAPLSLLCTDFLKSIVELNSPDKEKKIKSSDDDEVNMSDDSSDDENEDAKRKNLVERAGLIYSKTTPCANDALSEEYLRKIAAETIEIEF